MLDIHTRQSAGCQPPVIRGVEFFRMELAPLVDGKILVRRSQFDAWLERHTIKPGASVDVDAIVDGLLRDAG